MCKSQGDEERIQNVLCVLGFSISGERLAKRVTSVGARPIHLGLKSNVMGNHGGR